MARVDFYTGSADKLRTACVLSHKAMQHHLTVAIWLADEQSLRALDQLLWHYPSIAFIPHCHAQAADAAQMPVVLSTQPVAGRELLINLTRECVDASHYQRVLDVVTQEVADSQAGRQRYKYYRDQGASLQHFDLSKQSG